MSKIICPKCGDKIALVSSEYTHYHKIKNKFIIEDKIFYHCLPCIYQIDLSIGKSIMPFTKAELQKIKEGKKWTSIRKINTDIIKNGIHHPKFPFENHTIVIYQEHIFRNVCGIKCETMTEEVIKSEGFNTFEELIDDYSWIDGFRKLRFKNILGYEFRLYDLRQPIK